MGKKILKIGLIFLLFGLVILFTVSTILAFVAPAFMAKTFESLNMPTLAYGCYDRQYRNSTDVGQQYVMFTKAADISFDSHVVYYGEKLFENENYDLLIARINLSNYSKTEKYITENPGLTENEKIRLQILSRNEDNYIICTYVKSLVNLNKLSKAEDFLITQINGTISKNRFGDETSFAVQSYLEKVKILPDNLLAKVIEFFDKFEQSFEYDSANIKIQDRVCFQRLTEIASTLSAHYKNAGDQEKSNQWFVKAQNYLTLIYS